MQVGIDRDGSVAYVFGTHEAGQQGVLVPAVAREANAQKVLVLRGQLLTAVAAFMPDNLPGISPAMQPFLPIVEEMRRNLSASIGREEIAARYGWNPSSFSRAFRRAFGCGFKQYQERLLTERIAEELLVSNKTLQTIAEGYGFCDAYYLSAFFKRTMGTSPAIYRKQHER